MEDTVRQEILDILSSIENIFAPFWNDDNSIIKAVYDNDTIYIHFAFKPKTDSSQWYDIPNKKIFFLSQVLKTGFFNDSVHLARGTITLILSTPLREDVESIKEIKNQIILLKNYFS